MPFLCRGRCFFELRDVSIKGALPPLVPTSGALQHKKTRFFDPNKDSLCPSLDPGLKGTITFFFGTRQSGKTTRSDQVDSLWRTEKRVSSRCFCLGTQKNPAQLSGPGRARSRIGHQALAPPRTSPRAAAAETRRSAGHRYCQASPGNELSGIATKTCGLGS